MLLLFSSSPVSVFKRRAKVFFRGEEGKKYFLFSLIPGGEIKGFKILDISKLALILPFLILVELLVSFFLSFFFFCSNFDGVVEI